MRNIAAMAVPEGVRAQRRPTTSKAEGVGAQRRTQKIRSAPFLAMLISALLLGACAGDSSKKENIEPPTELVDFDATIAVERIWSADVGDGAGVTGAGLVPAVAGGRVFAASVDGGIHAYNAASGERIWTKEIDSVSGGPGASDTLVVAGTIEGQVIALDAETGEERWRVRVSSEVISPPVLSGDVVIVIANDGRTHALEAADGKLRWAVDRGVPLLSLRGNASPIVTSDRVLVASANGKVSALSLTDGRQLWEATVGAAEGRTDLERMSDLDGRMVLMDGDLYVAGYESGAQALTSDAGRTLWTRKLSSVAGLAAGREAIFVAATNGTVWSLDRRTGASMWKNETLKHRMLSVPVLMGEYVVVGDLEGQLHWFTRAEGTIAARSELGDEGFGAGLVVVDDVLYVQNRDGKIGAFRIGG